MIGEPVIKKIVELILQNDFDNILNLITDSIELSVKSEVDGGSQIVLGKDLGLADKFALYRQLWKITLENLYSKYLDSEEYKFEWKLELTPYTVTLLTLFPLEKNEPDRFADYLNTSDFNEAAAIGLAKSDLNLLEINSDQFTEALNKALPSNEADKMRLILRLVNFPPLQELSVFYSRVHKKYTEGLKNLFDLFSSGPLALPDFKVIEPYHYSVLHFSHKLFEKHGIKWFEDQPELYSFRQEFIEIHEKVEKFKDHFQGSVLCSCCGTEYKTVVPKQALEYKFLMEHDALAKDIGFLFIEDLKLSYMERLKEGFYHVLHNLNPKEQSKLLILVEGSSEETGVPILAFKRRLDMRTRGMRVYNCGSKEKLFRDFQAFSTAYPKMKMICLLDSDAVKQRNDIERMIQNKKNKYDLIYINDGTWEDIFDRTVAVETLNKLYPEGEDLQISDFIKPNDFASQANKILYDRKKVKFDKVKFSEAICWALDNSTLPKPISRLFDIAEKLLPTGDNIFKS